MSLARSADDDRELKNVLWKSDQATSFIAEEFKKNKIK